MKRKVGYSKYDRDKQPLTVTKKGREKLDEEIERLLTRGKSPAEIEQLLSTGKDKLATRKTVRKHIRKVQKQLNKVKELELEEKKKLPAIQEAYSRHQKELVKLAETWRYDMVVPEQKRAIIEIEPNHKWGNIIMDKEEHRKAMFWLAPGPKWYIKEGKVIAIEIWAEGNKALFNALLSHLKEEGLCNDYENWKRGIKAYIELCLQHKQDVEQGKIPKEVFSLQRKLEALTEKIKNELDIVIYRKTFKGRCPLCP